MDRNVEMMLRLLGLFLAVLAAVLIYGDAKSLRERGANLSPVLWAVLHFFVLIIALPIYLILRATVWRREIANSVVQVPVPELPPARDYSGGPYQRPIIEQLVGETCLVCSKRVSSVIDGRICSECGCAVHSPCMLPGTMDDDHCSTCGGVPRQRVAPIR